MSVMTEREECPYSRLLRPRKLSKLIHAHLTASSKESLTVKHCADRLLVSIVC